MRFKEWLLSEEEGVRPSELWRQLYWPPNTQTPPPPPIEVTGTGIWDDPGWAKHPMETKPDTVQKFIGNRLMKQYGPMAAILGNKAARYVDKYTAHPSTVHDRVLRKLSDRASEQGIQITPDYQKRIYEAARQAAKSARPVHQQLMARNYGYRPIAA